VARVPAGSAGNGKAHYCQPGPVGAVAAGLGVPAAVFAACGVTRQTFGETGAAAVGGTWLLPLDGTNGSAKSRIAIAPRPVLQWVGCKEIEMRRSGQAGPFPKLKRVVFGAFGGEYGNGVLPDSVSGLSHRLYCSSSALERE